MDVKQCGALIVLDDINLARRCLKESDAQWCEDHTALYLKDLSYSAAIKIDNDLETIVQACAASKELVKALKSVFNLKRVHAIVTRLKNVYEQLEACAHVKEQMRVKFFSFSCSQDLTETVSILRHYSGCIMNAIRYLVPLEKKEQLLLSELNHPCSRRDNTINHLTVFNSMMKRSPSLFHLFEKVVHLVTAEHKWVAFLNSKCEKCNMVSFVVVFKYGEFYVRGVISTSIKDGEEMLDNMAAVTGNNLFMFTFSDSSLYMSEDPHDVLTAAFPLPTSDSAFPYLNWYCGDNRTLMWMIQDRPITLGCSGFSGFLPTSSSYRSFLWDIARSAGMSFDAYEKPLKMFSPEPETGTDFFTPVLYLVGPFTCMDTLLLSDMEATKPVKSVLRIAYLDHWWTSEVLFAEPFQQHEDSQTDILKTCVEIKTGIRRFPFKEWIGNAAAVNAFVLGAYLQHMNIQEVMLAKLLPITTPIKSICDVFERLKSLGVKLTPEETATVVHSLITAHSSI